MAVMLVFGPILLIVLPSTTEACFEFTSAIPNPCIEKECPFGADCIPSFDGRSAECVCPVKCPTFGDSRGSRPICGGDGKNYPNLCELNHQACRIGRTVSVRYNGSCDPCYGVKCPDSQICQIDDNRNPICKCNAACGKEFEPVCGSSGETFVNECVLRVEACKARKSLRILHKGVCPDSNACKALKCSIYQECEIDRFGIAVCQCPSTCSKVLKPVCGSSGETFENLCELKRQACLSQRNITTRYLGICEPESFCHQNHGTCKFGSICQSLSRENHVCVCPSHCSEEYSPVCAVFATENVERTYSNLCKFRHDMCLKKTLNVTVRQGSCEGCENINCMFFSNCEAKGGKAKCVCPQDCDKIYEPVCGSDYVTYNSECELRVSSCQQLRYIVPIKRGPCASCENVHCDYGGRCENGVCVCPRKCPSYIEPVCGLHAQSSHSYVTYDNLCKLMAASCESAVQISVKSKGTCEELGFTKGAKTLDQLCPVNTCKYDGVCFTDQKRGNLCLCKFNCSNNGQLQQICGEDGRVYEGECVFREEMCNRQQEIQQMDKVFCEKYRNIPCEGESSIIDPMTHKEFNCSNAACPDGSYCHRGPNFAKCCRDFDLDENCLDLAYGCCPDKKTPALGKKFAGCPDTCQCNRLGSYLLRCDPKRNQCYCKPGVGGIRCDRCEAGYWGLHKISEGNVGCIPCQCNKMGASRQDCHQMTGQCDCKPDFKGMKCDICSDGRPVESFGCVRVESISCLNSSQCHFGAVCQDSQCRCDMDCTGREKLAVCASDGSTNTGSIYESECHVMWLSCKSQTPLYVVNSEKCRPSAKHSATTSPVRRSTEYQSYDKSTVKVEAESEAALATRPTMPTLHWDAESERSAFFGGSGYMELKTLPAISNIQVQVELVAYDPDGVILYNGQTITGGKDYLALLLKGAFVEFRFNLGSGSVLLRSSKAITLGQRVTIDMARHLSDGFLSVTGQENITAKSEGPHKLLDLAQNAFLGGTPYSDIKKIVDILGTRKNFTGCLRALRINEQLVELEPSASIDVLSHKQVGFCSRETCSRHMCHNLGTCLQNDSQYTCLCAPNYSGLRCQHSGPACKENRCPDEILNFSNDSYVELPTLQGVSQAFTLEVWLLARSSNGLILYNGQSKGDFVELSLLNGFLQYSFNLGGQSSKSGTMFIRSRTRLSIGQWHRVMLTRKVKEGMLQIDNEPALSDTAKGNLNELNLDEPLYLGGIGEKSKRKHEPVDHFNGAIQRIALNGNLWQSVRSRASKMSNVHDYLGSPCVSEAPCQNHGKCIPWLDSFICQCTPEFHGARCEQAIDSSVKAVQFDSSFYVEYDSYNFPLANQHQNVFELTLHTKSPNGLILWTSRDSPNQTHYLAVLLVDGYLELSFNLGKQTPYMPIRSTSRIDDGGLHHIIITRNTQVGTLQIDQKYMTSLVSEEGATKLNTDGKLWIGGYSKLPGGLPEYYYTPFSGCLQSVRVEGILLDLSSLTGQFRSTC